MVQLNANDTTQVGIHQLHDYVTDGVRRGREGVRRERGGGGRDTERGVEMKGQEKEWKEERV